jgi:hypothetical protein
MVKSLSDHLRGLPHMAHPQLKPFITALAQRAERGDITANEASEIIAVVMKQIGVTDLDIEFAVHPTPIVRREESPHMASDPGESRKGSIDYHYKQIIAAKTGQIIH